MLQRMTHVAAFIGLVSGLCATTAPAGVVRGTNIQLSTGWELSDYMLNVWQDEAATDITGVGFDLEGNFLIGITYVVDESSDWYAVNEDDVFASDIIAAGAFDPFIIGSTGQLETIPASGIFWLGMNTGRESDGSGTSRDAFGWAKLFNDGNSLALLDSAVAYHSAGIIVGTTREVPEPVMLCVWGIGGLILRGRRCGWSRHAA